jgi:hypothetical protein
MDFIIPGGLMAEARHLTRISLQESIEFPGLETATL